MLLVGLACLHGCVAELETLGRQHADEPTPDAPDCEIDPDACAPTCVSRMFGTLGAGPSEGAIVEVSLEDGALRHVASIDGTLGQIRGLTYAKELGAIYAVATAGDGPTLLQVQVDTGEIRRIGPVRPSDPERPPLLFAEGMDYNPCDGALYLAGGDRLAFSDKIFRIDRKTGAAEYVDAVGLNQDVDAMVHVACDLFLSDTDTGAGLTYIALRDMQDGGLTLRRQVFGRAFTDLAWDPLSETLYGVAAEDRQVVVLDLHEETRDEVLGTTHTVDDYNGQGMGGLVIVEECEG